MRLGIIADVLLCTVFYHLFQHELQPGIMDSGVELSVGKRSGTALPELNIAVRIQRPAVEECLSLLRTGLCVRALFDDDGPQPRPGEDQGGKDASRTESYDDRSAVTGNRGDPVLLFFIGLRLVLSYQVVLATAQGQGRRTDIMKILLSPGVQRSPDQFRREDLALPDPQPPGGLLCQALRRIVQLHPDISYKNHGISLPARRPLDHAHCRLNPPQSPSISSTSPQA